MTHWLIWIKRFVKILSIVVSLAFFVNSANGILSSIQLADGNQITQRPVEPGDFEINYQNRTINVAVIFNNTLFYDLEDVVFHLNAKVCINRSQPTEHNITIVDVYNNGIEIGENGDIKGITIHSGEVKEVGIKVSGDEAINMTAVFDYLRIDPDAWDITDLITNPSQFGLSETTTFEVYLTIEFSLSYAFGQYVIDVRIDLDPQAFNLGLGL